MELLNFINENINWKDKLSKPPYSLIIKEEDDFTLLKYNQLESDFNQEIVRECRGIILDKDNHIVCWPFYKFFNYGEVYADKLDWSSVSVQDKIDGTLMKLWNYKGEWKLSTNGSINAYTTPLNQNEVLKISCPYKTFGELFEAAENYKDIDFNSLNPNYTYMFELTSPYNRIVIEYPNIIINHIGTRNNQTGQELDVNIGVKQPQRWPITTLDQCIQATQQMGKDEEGFVVVDKNWKRVKIKNPIYLQLHRMISNNSLQFKDVFKMIIENEDSEFLSYFPEYENVFEDVRNKIEALKQRFRDNRISINAICVSMTRKDYAERVMAVDKEYSSYYFKVLDDPSYSEDDYIKSFSQDKLKRFLED